MDPSTLDHLSDEALFRSLNAAVSRARVNLAEILWHLAEFDARRLYASAGYPSMFAYCVEVLHFSEPEAGRRIHAARIARKFPALWPAISSGRLHLSAITLLAPHLSRENADELIEAATHRSKYAIETLLARRFPGSLPKVGVAVWIRPVAQRPVPEAENASRSLFAPVSEDRSEKSPASSSMSIDDPVPARHTEHFLGNAPTSTDAIPAVRTPVDALLAESAFADATSADATPADATAPDATPAAASPATTAPTSRDSSDRHQTPELFLIRVTVPRSTYDKLCEAQVLLSHVIRAQDLAGVLDRALDALIAMLKRRKLGVSPFPTRSAELSPKGGRYIPSHIRHAVWKRDGGQCTFVSADGHRCQERRYLEYDHVVPVARGGTAMVDTVRLRCRTHNQLEAERAFGTRFMDQKRCQARDARRKG